MRRLAAAALLLAPFQEEIRHKWAGFGQGSYVVTRVTRRLGQQESTLLEKVTVLKVEGSRVTLRFEEEGAPARTGEVDLDPEDVRKAGAETVDVDGRSFSCTIYETSDKDARGNARRVRTWMCREAPGRVVRLEQTTTTPKGDVMGSGGLVRLGQRREVNRVPVTYAVFEFTAVGPEGYRMSATRWVSEQVPGFTVKEEHREGREDAELVKITELVGFEARVP